MADWKVTRAHYVEPGEFAAWYALELERGDETAEASVELDIRREAMGCIHVDHPDAWAWLVSDDGFWAVFDAATGG